MRHQLLLVQGVFPRSCFAKYRNHVLLLGTGRPRSAGGCLSRRWVAHLLNDIACSWGMGRGLARVHNAHVCTVYCANGVREASNNMKSSLDCDLLFYCVWKLYVLCGQLIYCIYDSRESAADGQLWYAHPVPQLPLKWSSGQKAEGW